MRPLSAWGPTGRRAITCWGSPSTSPAGLRKRARRGGATWRCSPRGPWRTRCGKFYGEPIVMEIGIVGLPNVGKSSLFNALTAAGVASENFPFTTIEPNVGVVPVRDERLDFLQKVYSAPKKVPAAVRFVDIAGLVPGASKGEGLGNKFLSHIRENDAIAHVVRCFENDDIVHVAGRIKPLDDVGVINTELALADLDTVERATTRAEKSAK